ncbi:MAG: hypothetical protein MI747_14840, partial [Desulfobacterales bacterium]|nr:hypothetical protein [Desulfobacterales bacterium]
MPTLTYKTRRKFLYATAALVLFLVLFPLILEWVVNLKVVRIKAADVIQEKTGVNLDPDNLFFQLSPQIRLGLKNQSVSFGSQLHIRLKALNIDLDFLQLISGKLVLSDISLESPKIIFIPGPPRKTGETDSPPQETVPYFDFPKTAISELFALFPESQKQLVLNFRNVDSRYFKGLSGSLLLYRENEQLLLNAALNELDLTQETLPPDTFPEVLPIGGVTAQKAQVIMRLDSKGTLKTNLRLQNAEMIS